MGDERFFAHCLSSFRAIFELALGIRFALIEAAPSIGERHPIEKLAQGEATFLEVDDSDGKGQLMYSRCARRILMSSLAFRTETASRRSGKR